MEERKIEKMTNISRYGILRAIDRVRTSNLGLYMTFLKAPQHFKFVQILQLVC